MSRDHTEKRILHGLVFLLCFARKHCDKSVAVTFIKGNGCSFQDYEGGDTRQYFTYTKGDNGKACHFPFIFNGHVETECLKYEDYKWCATEVYYNSKKWGKCRTYAVGTYDGNGDGRPCKFPFMVDGELYYKCIEHVSGYNWCSTTSDYNVEKLWGKCFTGEGPPTTEGNGNGQRCHFPFMYENKEINRCILHGEYEWCGVTKNYDIDGKWGKCISAEDLERLPTIQAAVPSSAVLEALGGSAAPHVKNLPNQANAMMHSLNLTRTFQPFNSFAPGLAPCLGLLGVGFGMFNSMTQPTLADIVGKVNDAFDILIEEVDTRFEQLMDYADRKVLETHKSIKNDLYRVDQLTLSKILNVQDKELVDLKLQFHVIDLSAHRAPYMINGRPLNSTWTNDEVELAEALLPILKKHVDLHLLAAAALINQIRNHTNAEYIRSIKEEFVKDVKNYTTYIRFAYQQIYDRRITDQKFDGNKNFTCKNPNQEYYQDPFSLESFLTRSERECKFQCTNMRRDFSCKMTAEFLCPKFECSTWKPPYLHDVADLDTRTVETVNKVCRTYLKDLEVHMTNYWQREVLDYIPVWEAAANRIEKELNETKLEKMILKKNNVLDENLKKIEEYRKSRLKISEGLTADLPMLQYVRRALNNILKLQKEAQERNTSDSHAQEKQADRNLESVRGIA